MPKEFTHWTLAELGYRAMPDSSLKGVIEENKALYELGAVCFDSPYYTTGPAKPVWVDIATRLHFTESGNSFTPLVRLLEIGQSIGDNRVWALLAGCVSHIIADSRFHPLVYTVTGDLNDPDPNRKRAAEIGHRRFEAALDLYILETVEVDLGNPKAALFPFNPSDRKKITAWLAGLYEKNDPAAVEAALRNHARFLGYFQSRSGYWGLKTVNTLSGGRFDLELALCYPAVSQTDLAAFARPFEMTDPDTGAVRLETIPALIEQVIHDVLAVYAAMGKPGESETAIQYFSQNRGPVLA